MAGMRLPNNRLPKDLYEDVKIVNASTDVTFTNSYGKYDEDNIQEDGTSLGDIVLGPRQYTFRKKYEAMHWFGNWTKEGKAWEAEVVRVAKYSALLDEKDPQWLAIKEGKIYVEGYTEKKDYKNYSLTKYNDKHPKFSLDGPEDSAAYMKKEKTGLVLDLPADFGVETADVTSLKK